MGYFPGCIRRGEYVRLTFQPAVVLPKQYTEELRYYPQLVRWFDLTKGEDMEQKPKRIFYCYTSNVNHCKEYVTFSPTEASVLLKGGHHRVFELTASGMREVKSIEISDEVTYAG